MDRDNKTKRKINPRETTNIFSLVTFFYTLRMFAKGYTKGLEMNDIYEVLPNAHSKKLGEKLEYHWHKEKEKNAATCRALLFCFGRTFLLIGLLQFATEIVKTVWSPKALSKVVSYFSPGQKDLTKQDAVYYGCLLIAINLTNSLVRCNCNLMLAALAVRAKAAISSLLYRKSLKLSPESLSAVTAGKIVTIISKDVDIVEIFVRTGNGIWIAVIQTAVICYLIYQKIGVASFTGIAFFLVVFPFQVFIGSLTYRQALKCSEKTDDRLNLIREVLAASKIIKMYTWEKIFENKIHDSRRKELKKLHKLFYTRMWITVIGSICSKSAFFLFMMTYVWMGHNVSAETVYYILSCFNDLEGFLASEIPTGFSYFAQMCATTRRIESVMNAPEIKPSKLVESVQAKVLLSGVDVTIHDKIILKKVSLDIEEGLNIVVGHTGAGKTTLLKSILGECQTTGSLNIAGKISYASQEPWLFPATIKNNIIFGKEFNEKRYRKILEICNLDYDLNLMPKGENTVVGESGVNLSKGQQARINLARAVYRESDLYLLDDCLASLDCKVSDSIFQKCIHEFLNNKIRIFVTSNTDHIQKADRVIVVRSKSAIISNYVQNTQISYANASTDDFVEANETKIAEDMSVKKQIYYEKKNPGMVPLKDYLRYIEYGGGLVLFILVVSLFVLAQAAASYSDKLLSKWVTVEQNLTNLRGNNQTYDDYQHFYEESRHELGLYTIMVLTFLLLVIIKCFSHFHFIRMASINLHKAMVHSVINTSLEFFDSHFIGNVINRFSKDFVDVDDTLPFMAAECFTMIFAAAGAVILLTTVNYLFLFEGLLFLFAVVVVKQFCQPTGRNLGRLHVIARSPLTGHLNATLEGLTTIRACNAQNIVIREFDRLQNVFTSAYFMVVTSFTAVAVFVNYVGMIFVSVIIFQFLLTDLGISVGDVGLAITQSFIIANIITVGITRVSDTENLMISVERVLEFTELKEEDKDGKILIDWPEMGSITFSDVSLTYKNTKMLSNINFVVNPKDKFGIVGRTGAGKSSIISSLFRFYQTQGTITIDGVDIRDVSLNWLRSNISVIPQDPYLFPGSIRENLDPLKRYTDEQIWKVLKELQLDDLVGDLGVRVDKGATCSTGQKQLLCLARVILRKSKIVILDEATANVDKEMETLMQTAIQKHFSECTMLIIAHKSITVQNCSKIMVLNEGRICAFHEPSKLLNRKTLIAL